MHVERIDSKRHEPFDPIRDTFGDPPRAGRAHEPDVRTGSPQLGEQVEVFMTGPQPPGRTDSLRCLEHGERDLVMLEVERQVEPGSARVVQLGEGRHAPPSEVGGPGPRHVDPAAGRPHSLVVDENGDPVRGEPGIRFEAGRALAQGQRECFEGVLRGVSRGTPVGKRDRLGGSHGTIILTGGC